MSDSKIKRLESELTPPSITLATPTMSATIQRREHIENIAISALNRFPTFTVNRATSKNIVISLLEGNYFEDSRLTRFVSEDRVREIVAEMLNQ